MTAACVRPDETSATACMTLESMPGHTVAYMGTNQQLYTATEGTGMRAGSLHMMPASAMLSNSFECVVTPMQSASQVVLHACYKQQGWCMQTMHSCDKIKHRRMTHFDAGGLCLLYLGELSFHQHSGGACCLHCCQHCIFISNAVPLYILWLQSSHA